MRIENKAIGTRMDRPLVSIVIANYNYGRYLEAAIQSVINQDCSQIELIICDAGSTDNSIKIIEKYANGLLPNVYRNCGGYDSDAKCDKGVVSWWCSEPDGGQSAAFNKGFSQARGEWFTWLNADDIMLPGVIHGIKKIIASNPNVNWITGNFVRFDQSSGMITEAAWGPNVSPRFLQGKHFPISVFGPTSFWRRSVYKKIGPIDETLHYTMDVDYWRRMVAEGYTYTRLNIDCWAFRMHKTSKTAEFEEHERSAKVKLLMDRENSESIAHTGCYVRWWGKLSRHIVRIVDGSAIKYFWRKFTLVGRDLADVYGVKVG